MLTELEADGSLNSVFETFRQADQELRARSIALLRVQFADQIVNCSKLGESIKWIDSMLPKVPSDEIAQLAEERRICIQLQKSFPRLARFWWQIFQIHYNPDKPSVPIDPNEPVDLRSYLPEAVRSWFEISN